MSRVSGFGSGGTVRLTAASAHAEGQGRNVNWFREGLVFKAHILVYRSTLGWRVKEEKAEGQGGPATGVARKVFSLIPELDPTPNS